MRLNEKYVSKHIYDSYIMVSAGKNAFEGLVTANETAGFIIECLKTETSREQIIEKVLEEYNAPVDIVTEDVDKVLETLRGINAIDE